MFVVLVGLVAIAVEFDLMYPALAVGHFFNSGRKRRFDEGREGRFDADIRRLSLERHGSD